jgi:hypothetical protein
VARPPLDELRADLHDRRIGYVLAVARDHRVSTGIGVRRAIDLAVRLPAQVWARLSAGTGAKGQRWYDWALIGITDLEVPGDPRIADPPIDRYRTRVLPLLHTPPRRRWPHPVRPNRTPVHHRGSFQAGRGLTGLDEHQVRRWSSWHRWTILAMLAHAFLAITAATAPTTTGPPQPIALTANEI